MLIAIANLTFACCMELLTYYACIMPDAKECLLCLTLLAYYQTKSQLMLTQHPVLGI